MILRAKPNARHNQLLRATEGGWAVRVAAPAPDGQANAVLLAFLADVLGVSKSRELLRGAAQGS